MVPPIDPGTCKRLQSLGIAAGEVGETRSAGILPVTKFRDFREVEAIARTIRELLEYERTDLAHLGEATHIRRAFPEWADDSAAIAKATFDRVSGTGDPHRGFGLGYVFDVALQDSLHAAEFEIYSANGFLRTKIFDGRREHLPSPPPHYQKGTSIVCKLESAGG